MLRCISSSTRTQVYLTHEQRKRLDALAEAEGVTMAEIVRRALDAYLDEEAPDPELVLAATFGAAPDAAVPSRDEWDHG
ncbi:MAG: CopG family transcriptional regulator [Acidimicrobiia bacterium]